MSRIAPPLTSVVEPVEKVNLARIRRVGRKRNLSGYSVYDDLMLGRNQGEPRKSALNGSEGVFLQAR